MDIKHRMENHYKRWNIKLDWEEQFAQLRNRVLIITNELVGRFFASNISVDQEFAFILGQPIEIKQYSRQLVSILPPPVIHNFTKPRICKFKAFGSTYLYNFIEKTSNLVQLVTALEVLFCLLEKHKHPQLIELAEQIREVGKLTPSAGFNVVMCGTSVTLYPLGAELLDEGIVNEVLGWLQRYPNVAKHFENALQTYQTGDASKYRNLLDNLRFALEQLLKEVLKNDKSLEKQNEFLLAWLKNQGLHQQLISMYRHLVENYVNYQNNAVKHNEAFSVDEIEFMIYLTGTFMRLLLQLAEKTNKVIAPA